MRKTIVYISLILIFVCPPVKNWGQSVQRVDLSKITGAVLLVSDGVYSGAVWELGRSLLDSKTSATFRHTVNAGNGNNPNVNSKLPYRLLIAPTDVPGTLTWAEAMGFDAADNGNLDVSATNGVKKGGCATYKPTGENLPGYVGVAGGWRLPTQRELQMMWLFRDAIDKAFNASGYWAAAKLKGFYWSSTEQDAANAWYLDFDNLQGPSGSGTPNGKGCYYYPKTTPTKVRCVRDL